MATQMKRTSERPALPREHGFWVMLVLSLAAGVIAAEGAHALVFAGVLAVGVTLSAQLIGKRIRKNLPLQLASALALGALVVPIGLFGGASPGQVAAIAMPLSLVFLADTLGVQAILFRARRAPKDAERLALCSISLCAGGAVIAAFVISSQAAAALLVGMFLSLVLAWLRPSAKKLKRVGIAVACANTLSVTLLLL